ncbi:MAG: CTP synthase [Candidatus Aenigmatarchaeota archaeon]
MRANFVFVTGGVLSGLGKGITTASIGLILKSKGFKVTAMKIDPYVNYDAGTLRPTEHGEVWVTDDGGEIDQDLGHYERFLNQDIGREHNITTGQVYGEVIRRERAGEYLGQTVQPIPHITDEIKRRMHAVAEKTGAEFVMIEIGGTVGDYENILFLEAARQMKLAGEAVAFVHVVYMPVLRSVGEAKTKPIQHSVRELNGYGIQPDFIVVRSEQPIDQPRRNKIALFCNVKDDEIIGNHDVRSAYEVPLVLEAQDMGGKLLAKLGMEAKTSDLREWRAFVDRMYNAKRSVRIGIVGKYFDVGDYKLPDAYVSVIEAIKHAAAANDTRADIVWLDSKAYEKDPAAVKELAEYDGIIVPGGFGSSGVEGKINAIKFVRENKIPYLGLCYGLQLAVVEFARDVCGIRGAHTTEVEEGTKEPVIDFLPWQKELIARKEYGGTMRLGGQTTIVKPGTLAHKLYGKERIRERFRHRYEINPKYVGTLVGHGFVFSGQADPQFTRGEQVMQIGELPRDVHPFFCGSQFHPEFCSRPLSPNPLYVGFVAAAAERAGSK